MTDAKLMDGQAALETLLSVIMAKFCGSNLVRATTLEERLRQQVRDIIGEHHPEPLARYAKRGKFRRSSRKDHDARLERHAVCLPGGYSSKE